MTRYDPFSFGQVSLGKQGEAGGAATPDDMLFADAGPLKQPPPADSDWSAPPPIGASARSGTASSVEQFGVDILGEDAGPPPAPAKAQEPAANVRPKAATTPRPVDSGAKQGVNSPNAERPQRQSPMQSPAPAAAAARIAPPAKTKAQQPAMPSLRRSPMLGLVVPSAIVAVGGSAASWLWLLQQNPVMAGIVGGLSLVGAALAWVMLRA